MLTFTHPALRYKSDLLSYRREVIRTDSDFDGTAGLGNFSDIRDWLELIFAMEPERAGIYGYYPTLVYLAFDDELLVGICNVRLNNDDEIRSRAGHIGYHVRPSMRKRGYGKTILSHAVGVCAEHGIVSPVVCTFPGNTASEQTALGCGFVRDSCDILENGETVCRFIYKNE